MHASNLPYTARPSEGVAGFVPSLPTLRKVVEKYPSPQIDLVLIAHILDTAVPYVETLSGAMDMTAAIAVPYSARKDVCQSLNKNVPLFVPPGIDEIGTMAIDLMKKRAATSSNPAVIQEVGGYCAPHVHSAAEESAFAGFVEDTKQGHWRYEQIGELPVPVFSIADSPLKALEDTQVGRSIAYSADRILRSRFYRLLAETKVGVLGYGGIGKALTDSLRSLGADVGVYDVDSVRMCKAVTDGHKVYDRSDLLRRSDLILGVSGHRSMGLEDFRLLRQGAVVGSGSSKQVEFDVAAVESAAQVSDRAGEVTEYRLDDSSFFLLNDGKPINFLDQSILGDVLDLVYSELYMCTRELVVSPPGPGLHRLNPDMQQEIAAIWCDDHGVRL